MACVIHADLIDAACQRIEDGVQLDARQSKDNLDAVCVERVDKQVGAGDGGALGCHRSIVDAGDVDVHRVAVRSL